MDKKAECIQKGKNNQVGVPAVLSPPSSCCHPPAHAVTPLTGCFCVPPPLQTDCFNYVRFLQSYNSSHLYACGTYAFQPKCTYIVSATPRRGHLPRKPVTAPPCPWG